MFPLDSIMYEGMGLAFNQAHQPLYVVCALMLVVLIAHIDVGGLKTSFWRIPSL